MRKVILVLNAGSSSLKFALYPDESGTVSPILRGRIAGMGKDPILSMSDVNGQPVHESAQLQLDCAAGYDQLIPTLLDFLKSWQGGLAIVAAGHRVVHGGLSHARPAMVTTTLLAELEALVSLAPLHQPHNLAAIRCVDASLPGLPQVACFDTSFHRTQGRLAQLFALPRKFTEAGIIRYGFHGLSYDYIATVLPRLLGERAEKRVLVAHLGNGASLCAMKARRSVATSTGFTALDGLMMGRRCGAIDPGVLLYLMDNMGMSVQALEHLLYEESGLLGVSGISNDMAVLQASTAAEAEEAIDLFCYRASGELAALATAIGGVDAIVFTAGIGENCARIRSLICDRLGWMGVHLDATANDRHASRINSSDSTVDVLVIRTDEEAVVARATYSLTTALTDQLTSGRA